MEFMPKKPFKPTKENTAWRQGYELGLKKNEKEAKLGKAIIDILYEFFEPVKEDYD